MKHEDKNVLEILDELAPLHGAPAKERRVKDKLEDLVREMYASGILYSEAAREFKKRFILNVLKQNRGNQCKAARELGMHRNTLSRTIAELGMQGDIDSLILQCGGRSNASRVKLEKEYAPVHVTKLLVPRKKSTGVSTASRQIAIGS
jgi:DNA-binding protein Fis